MSQGQSHITSIHVRETAAKVFAVMADREKLHRWSFGTWETRLEENGVVRGKSIFDGSEIFVGIDADEERLSIDYRIGADATKLVPRITVRVVPGENLGMEPGSSVLTFIAWRSAAMDDDRWRRLTTSHEFEVVLLKNLIENRLI